MKVFLEFIIILAIIFDVGNLYKIEKLKHSENSIFNNEEACHITDYIEVEDAVKNCPNLILDSLTVPGGKSLNLKLQDNSTLVFRGKHTFEYDPHYGYLVYIAGNGLTVYGEKDSVLDGNGPLYWDGRGQWGASKPNMVQYKVTNSWISGINLLNCPKLCSACKNCDNVIFENMLVNVTDGLEENAGLNKGGHNTDGIDLNESTNIVLKNSTIINQDDCICLTEAINITVSDIYCYGGHGLSVTQTKGITENITFMDSIVEHSMNGIHVKTPGIGQNVQTGTIRNVTYRNIQIKNATSFGINIQENYVNKGPGVNKTVPEPSNSIPIYSLNLINITTTTADSATPLSIICAKDGCFNWQWSEVQVNKFGQKTGDNICVNFMPSGFQNCTLTNSTDVTK